MPKKSDAPADEEEDRDAFGRALADALAARGLTQARFGELIGHKQASVSAWINGQSLPDTRHLIFEIERVLDLPAGHLSRHLGYLPPSAAGELVVDTAAAIELDPLIPDEVKASMLQLYRFATTSPGVPKGRPRKNA